MAAQDDVYYDETVATSYLQGGAGAVSSRMSLLVASEADNSDTTEQVDWQHLVYIGVTHLLLLRKEYVMNVIN